MAPQRRLVFPPNRLGRLHCLRRELPTFAFHKGAIRVRLCATLRAAARFSGGKSARSTLGASAKASRANGKLCGRGPRLLWRLTDSSRGRLVPPFRTAQSARRRLET
eukprot:scaffold7351_cov259-Pinguiococcus_pyrenoidosus.AAC.5